MFDRTSRRPRSHGSRRWRIGIRQGIEEVLRLIWGSYEIIWSFPLTNVKWHSVTWPYTMTTPYWSDFVLNSTFYRILIAFNRTFATFRTPLGTSLLLATGAGMPTGDAYSSGHLVPSLWDLHMFYLLRPILIRTCRYFNPPPVGTRGLKSRMRHPYPHACRKRRLKWGGVI